LQQALFCMKFCGNAGINGSKKPFPEVRDAVRTSYTEGSSFQL
jgi:hypothetical protein